MITEQFCEVPMTRLCAGRTADLMVAGDQVSRVEAWLSSHGIQHSVMVDNVQTLIGSIT